jgi:hypothetical protein
VVLLQDLNLDFWFLFLPALSAAEFSISVQAQPFCFWSSTCCWLFGQGATTGPSPQSLLLARFQAFNFRLDLRCCCQQFILLGISSPGSCSCSWFPHSSPLDLVSPPGQVSAQEDLTLVPLFLFDSALVSASCPAAGPAPDFVFLRSGASPVYRQSLSRRCLFSNFVSLLIRFSVFGHRCPELGIESAIALLHVDFSTPSPSRADLICSHRQGFTPWLSRFSFARVDSYSPRRRVSPCSFGLESAARGVCLR